MGCCESTFVKGNDNVPGGGDNNKHNQRHNLHHRIVTNPVSQQPSNGTDTGGGGGGGVGSSGGVPAFSEFSLSDLKTATNNFSSDFIVSESGEKAPNVVYKGRLQTGSGGGGGNNKRWIAVKKFTKMAWPDPKQFAVCVFMCFCFEFNVL